MTREEAINEIRSWDFLEGKEIEAIHTLIPELRESDDERIRKELINFLRSPFIKENLTDEKVAPWISYLEKQKEHQNNSDAREKALGRDLTFPQDKDKNLDEIAQDYVDGVKEYNPEPTWNLMQTAVCYGYHYCEQAEQKPEWSEEDEKMLNDILGILHSTEDAAMANFSEQKKWLKSLRPSWKPTEEQIYSLGTVVKGYNEYNVGSVGYNLKELYEQLKKL